MQMRLLMRRKKRHRKRWKKWAQVGLGTKNMILHKHALHITCKFCVG